MKFLLELIKKGADWLLQKDLKAECEEAERRKRETEHALKELHL